MPFLAYYGCSKLLKARAVFYWGTHTRFTVRVGIDLSLTKIRRTRSAGCICMDKRARISPLWEIVYYLDTCIVYLAVRDFTEYPTHARTVVPRPFFPSPAKTAWERGYMLPSLVPRPFLRGRGKTAWAPLLAHARRSHKNMGIRARLCIVRLHISNLP